MTGPSFDSAVIILTGWIFAPRRTVTSMIAAAGAVGRKHHSAFHRLFASARWSRDQLGLLVFDMLAPWLDGVVMLALDDTLARKRGLNMFGVGMHHDPLLSSRGKAITNWGHSWVVLGMVVRFPLWPQRAFCLPILFRLYLNKDAAARHRRAYRTRPELAVEMLALLCQARKSRHFHVIADSAYGGQSVLNHLPKNCDLTSRLLLNARLYGPRPQRMPGTNGRPRKRGPQLPTPAQMLLERAARVELDLYGRRDRVRLCDGVGHVYAAPERPLRIVAVEALSGGRGQQAFYSTCWQATAIEILSWYAWRWSIEVAFHDSKQSLGFEEPQGWTRHAVERTAPMAMLLYSLIVLWFVREGHRCYRSLERPWYTTKSQPSFADMLATLRRVSLREQVSSWGLGGQGSRKVLQVLENTA
ncbi:MAG: transposase, partial [candidate division Zixibacteria bacterium]|nr:transposase [candidate division Zixibacteria bacterium]